MNRFTYKGFTLLFLLFCQTLLIAQEKGEYEGPFQIGKYTGNARYQYYTSATDTVLDGPFLFQKSNLETLLKEQDSSFTIKGNFIDALANGPWQFQFGKYTSDSKSEVVDFEYRILVSGTQEMATGVLSEGLPDGDWHITVQEVENSEVTNILFKSEFNFEKGVPQQSFKIESDSSALVGRFLRNGVAHDAWTSYGSNALEVDETWYFEEGLLQKIVFDATGEEVPVFDMYAPQYEMISLDDRFLLLLRYNLRDKIGQGNTLQLLSKNREVYQKINTILTQLGSLPFDTNIKVQVPVYALDSLQKETLERISDNLTQASELSKTILSNSHLNIIRRTDTDAQYWYSVTEKLVSEFLSPLESYVDLYQNQIFEFVNPSTVEGRIFPVGIPDKTIEVQVGQEPFQLPEADAFNFQGSGLQAMEQISVYAQMSMEYILDQLSNKLSDDIQIQSLKELETNLISVNNGIEKQIDSLLPQLPENYANALKNLGDTANQKLATYANISNPGEKLSFGEDLQSCLEDIRSLIKLLSNFPEKIKEIKALYTDDIWNPFMATVMDEEVKKRIVEAYRDILVPYFVQTISQTGECDRFALLREQIVYANNRMVDLRNKETRKLERKLKRARTAEEILKLFQQQIPKED
ncbi:MULTISPECIES: hypothetical protein [Maribacter]|uniref:Uncharacterized protein n=1 Tax=Maribacter flavus TaxID=1658664 RepID=A0ABU7II07_9FLAO|nr:MULTISPECIES: hypothetical protein [Maribacter]MDC6405658.1 hypothetical protein [Maribacter sp. PR66]MEE1972574.1 hypothetical protein [Maribacter flavus]